MKKLICLLLALVMVMAMAACSGKTEATEATETTETINPNQAIYEEAAAAYNAKSYAEAVELLVSLGDYGDAARLLATLNAKKTAVVIEKTTSEGVATSNVALTYQDGHMIKETATHADGTVTKNYYKYNDKGLCTSETLNDVDGGKTIINHFYEDGIKIRSIRTNPDKTKDTFEYNYDEQGKLMSHTLTLSDGSVEETVYGYDEATGLLAYMASANSYQTFAYNHFGDLTNEFLTIDGVDIHKIAYTYTYSYSVR